MITLSIAGGGAVFRTDASYNRPKRRGVRVAEGARLESVCAGKTCAAGSNPALSAILVAKALKPLRYQGFRLFGGVYRVPDIPEISRYFLGYLPNICPLSVGVV